MTKELYNQIKQKALAFFEKANIVLTDAEKEALEVADFGLGDVYNTGLEIITYVNTQRCCAKELVLLPGQTCPEHRHPKIEDKNIPGKEETFRCRFGKVYLYVEGEPAERCEVPPPEGVYTVFNQVVLNPGEQYTLTPNTKHWFKAGEQGAVISEFSTSSYDEFDVFSDERIKRMPEIEG